MLTALLYVCAKSPRHIKDAERIFWEEFPLRKVAYSLATINSFMYLYAKRNKVSDDGDDDDDCDDVMTLVMMRMVMTIMMMTTLVMVMIMIMMMMSW